VKPSHAANHNLIDRTRQVWQPRLGRDLSREDARQIAENVTGFFAILAEWSRAETPVPANDMRKPSTSDAGDVRREKRAGGGWTARCPVHDDGDGGWE
jgi:hypothetical protein